MLSVVKIHVPGEDQLQAGDMMMMMSNDVNFKYVNNCQIMLVPFEASSFVDKLMFLKNASTGRSSS